MINHYVYADEAGCFTFLNNGTASKYFILCTVTMDNCAVGNALLDLRRRLIWDGHGEFLGDYFHACDDKQRIRNEVYSVLQRFDFKIQATIMPKAKAQPQTRKDKPTFYQYGWYYHFTHRMPHIVPDARLLVTAASLGNKKEKLSFSRSIENVMKQTINTNWHVDFRKCKSDPCLQVADYCAWAIQRKWEREDDRSYNLIRNKISAEYDLWKHGNKLYY